jgi:hypothetical protein
MKKLILLFTLIFLYLMTAAGQVISYRPGEKLEYNIHYGVVNGGIATLEVTRDTSSGKELWHSKMEARTVGMVDAIFKVKDIYESFINPETELPVRSIRNISEGRYKKYNVVLFDHSTRQDSAIILLRREFMIYFPAFTGYVTIFFRKWTV